MTNTQINNSGFPERDMTNTQLNTNFPARYKNVKYEDVREDIRTLFENMKESRKGIYIWGGIGSGKTHTLYALKGKTPEIHKAVSMIKNTTELLRDIRTDFDKPNEEKKREEDIVMDFKGILFVDDIGAEKMTDWVAETFYMIFNRRYNEMRTTIFTSNLSPSELSEKIGDRIVSRIVGSCDVIKLDGEDRRVENIKDKMI